MHQPISRCVAALTGGLAIAMLSGCADAPGDWGERVAQTEDPIINGQLDTTHDAVVALFGQQSGCTGTIISAEGTTAYILTAAHCFEQDALQQAVIGDNYQNPEIILSVADWQQHPQWNPNDLAYDFAMIRAVVLSGFPTLPVIPVLQPTEDGISAGTSLVHVGYGITSVPNGGTTRRHFATGYVNQVAQIQFDYQQPNQGPCSGDSGGPNLVDLGSGERVAGVISYGDQTCATFGVSGRASSVYDFISGFMGVTPPSTSAASSTAATSSSTGTGAGGGATTGSGAGGATASSTGSNYFAGDQDNDDYDGSTIVGSGCSMSAPGQDQGLALSALALVGLLFGRRRRRSRA